jgi:hypothetical protein
MDLLAPFNQAQEVKKLGSDRREGVCLACSMEWVRLALWRYQSMQASDAKGRMDLLSKGFSDIISNQDMATQCNNARKPIQGNSLKQAHQERFSSVLDWIGTRNDAGMLGPTTDAASTPKVAFFRKTVQQTVEESAWQAFCSAVFAAGRAHILGIKYITTGTGATGRHAVATMGAFGDSGQAVFFFDANSGEWKVGQTELADAVNDAIQLCEAGAVVHTLRRWEVVRQDAPSLPSMNPDDNFQPPTQKVSRKKHPACNIL